MGSHAPGPQSTGIKVGASCLVSFMGKHYLVRILELDAKTMKLSFPGRDYPIEGLTVHLEFHDETGIDCYSTEVLGGPSTDSPTIIVQRPPERERHQHRAFWRVSTDLTVQIKDQVHIRRYDASVVNLSQGGALLRTDAPFELDNTVEMTLSLPGYPAHAIYGTVVHINTGASNRNGALIGVRFLNVEPPVSRNITDYIWSQMRHRPAR